MTLKKFESQDELDKELPNYYLAPHGYDDAGRGSWVFVDGVKIGWLHRPTGPSRPEQMRVLSVMEAEEGEG